MKKRTLLKLITVVLVLALCAGLYVTSTADDNIPTVIYNYKNTGNEFTFKNAEIYDDGHGHQYPNLFPDMQGLMPGDKIEQEIKVRADDLGSGSWVDMTLRAHLDGDNITEDEKADYDKLINSRFITLVVKNGETEITGDLASGVALGHLTKSSPEITLTVVLDIDIEADEEIANLQGAVHWEFVAAYDKNSSVTPGGGTTTTTPPILETEKHYAYIIGRDDGLIHPTAPITRAEVATMFFRLLTDDARAEHWSQTNSFTDVESGAWYNNAVSTMTSAKIINGRPGGVYDPNAPITRAEFAAIAIRFFGGEYEGEDYFSDIDGHWAQEEINCAAEKGLILGYPDGTFLPGSNITRAEAMTLVNRVLGRTPHVDNLLPDMTTWLDNDNTAVWYYADIQEATNFHNYERKSAEDFEVWTEILSNRDWAELEREWSTAN